nr:MAG TPA: hypothetical protein [Caudoviricetes sp.]
MVSDMRRVDYIVLGWCLAWILASLSVLFD